MCLVLIATLLLIGSPSIGWAQASCSGVLPNDGGSGFENRHFDTVAGTCGSNTAGTGTTATTPSVVDRGKRDRNKAACGRIVRGLDNVSNCIGKSLPGPTNLQADFIIAEKVEVECFVGCATSLAIN